MRIKSKVANVWLMQRLVSSDIVSPDEFARAVKGAFLDVARDADGKVGSRCFSKIRVNQAADQANVIVSGSCMCLSCEGAVFAGDYVGLLGLREMARQTKAA